MPCGTQFANPFSRPWQWLKVGVSLARFFDRIAEQIAPLKVSSVLEFGCGEGFFLKELEKRGIQFKTLTGIDLREEAIRSAKELFPIYMECYLYL